MLLRWLMISVYFLGTLVVRTRGMGSHQCEDDASNPHGGRRQRERRHAESPRSWATPRAPMRRSLGSDPRLAVLSGVIVSVITLLAIARWTTGFGRVRGAAMPWVERPLLP